MKNIYTEMLKTNISENLIQFQLIKSWKTNALGEKGCIESVDEVELLKYGNSSGKAGSIQVLARKSYCS